MVESVPGQPPSLGFGWGGIAFVALTVFLTTAGCASDAENIRATNEAARTPPATSTPRRTSTPLSAEIGSTEIQDGDCINSRIPEGIDIESVVIVPCNTSWQYRALSSFEVDDLVRYPGEASFTRRAYEECDRRFSYTLFPTEESWTLGDRSVTCLQESFGLSAADPAKLDRLVNNYRLNAGDCFNEAPETDEALVELVNCSSDWQFRALKIFVVDDTSRYPGEDTLSLRAQHECDRRSTNFRFPPADSWAAGGRTVTCLQESFGLSMTDPSKLDRLVSSGKLDIQECFNEAPETDYQMVEVVSCTGDRQYRTLNSFTVDDFDRYPGQGLFDRRAYDKCGRRYSSTLFPTTDTWAQGDRTVTCLQKVSTCRALTPRNWTDWPAATGWISKSVTTRRQKPNI